MAWRRSKTKNTSAKTPKNTPRPLGQLLKAQKPSWPSHSSLPKVPSKRILKNFFRRAKPKTDFTPKVKIPPPILPTFSSAIKSPIRLAPSNNKALPAELKGLRRLFKHIAQVSVGLSLLLLPAGLIMSWALESRPFNYIRMPSEAFYSNTEWKKILSLTDQSNFNSFDPYVASIALNVLPWIKQGQVSKFPPNALLIRAEIRKPIAYLESAGELSLLDEDGVVLPLDRHNQRWDLPVLKFNSLNLANLSSYKASKLLSNDLYGQQVMAFINQLQKSITPDFNHIDAIDARRPYKLEVSMLPYGYRLIFTIDKYAEQLQYWSKVFPKVEKLLPSIAVIDLRVPSRFIIAYR